MSMKSVLILLFLLSFAPQSARAAGVPIGRFEDVTGTATFLRDQGQATPVKTGDPIYIGDKIETAAATHLALHFNDDTQIILGPNGKLTVDEYIYDPSEPAQNKARFKILDTAFSFIDGKVAKVANPDVKIELNYGSIGVRGTQLMRGMRDHKCFIYLQEGTITVSNDGGAVALRPGQMTQMDARTNAPGIPRGWSNDDLKWIKSQLGI